MKNDGRTAWDRDGLFGDSGDAVREEHFTRKACGELLLDAGAVVAPSYATVSFIRAQGV